MPSCSRSPEMAGLAAGLAAYSRPGLGAEGTVGEQPESFTTLNKLCFPSLAYPEPSVALCQVCIPSRH